MKGVRCTVSILIALTAALALPGVASASSTQESMFQDDAQLLGRDLGTQLALLDELQALGVDTIHAIVIWPKYVPGNPASSRKPRGNSASPLYYPAEKWDLLDSLVRQTSARRMSLFLSPAGSAAGGAGLRVPRWARSGNTPKTVEFSRFVTALAKRYNGGYTDENGGGKLPKVRRWGIWNEPNQGGWIQPQWKRVSGKRVPYSPVIYRDLYNAGRRALINNGHTGSKIYLGELAPTGVEHRRRNATSATSPGLFLREIACVDSQLRRFRGSDARRRKCQSFRKISTSGIAHHIYTEGKTSNGIQGATYRPPRSLRDDHFPVGNLKAMAKLLKQLGSRSRLPRGLKIWNTEFGFQSNPPDRVSGVSPALQAEQENVAEYISFKDGNIRSFQHYLMIDDITQGSRFGGFQTGLRLLGGAKKPAYDAFAMPIVVIRSGGGVKVWGANRVRGRGSSVQILANGGVVRTTTIGNVRGYFQTPAIAVSRTARFQLVDPATGQRSRVARVTSGLK